MWVMGKAPQAAMIDPLGPPRQENKNYLWWGGGEGWG